MKRAILRLAKGLKCRFLPKEATGEAGGFSVDRSPWDWQQAFPETQEPCFCNLCWWSGPGFHGTWHSESAACPRCGSVSRDRFLFHCFLATAPPAPYRVLETSPRLGEPYREAMRTWFRYRASDFDQRSHRADLQLDLQEIRLPDESVDVLLTPHVLEHVPDTDRALSEIFRILSPGGRMYLQVPTLQGATARPERPEFHGDDTPVEWRFGPDLTDRLRAAGFRTRLLCTKGLARHVAAGARHWPDPVSPEFDVPSILAALRPEDLTPIADDEVSRRCGFLPSYMFLTWEAIKDADA